VIASATRSWTCDARFSATRWYAGWLLLDAGVTGPTAGLCVLLLIVCHLRVGRPEHHRATFHAPGEPARPWSPATVTSGPSAASGSSRIVKA